MKKSDFVEVHVYMSSYTYSGGILFSKNLVESTKWNELRLIDKTLLTKEFYDKFNVDGVLDFLWIE